MRKALLFWCVVFAAFAAAQARASQDGAVRMVVLGDSLVAGYNLAPGDAFPSQLQDVLRERGFDVDVVNAGVSGDTSAGALTRLQWAVEDGTDLVIVEIGANDALRGVPPANTKAAVSTIVSRLKARKIDVLLAGMRAPPNMGSDYVAEFDAIYPAVAKEFDVPLYPFFLDGVATHPNLTLADGMHPNHQGVAEIVKRIRPMVETLLIDIAQQKSDAKRSQ